MSKRNYVKEVYALLNKKPSYDDIRDYITNFKGIDQLIMCKGRENIVDQGPSIIIANYTGSGRDIIGLIREYDSRRLYGVIPRFMFSKDAPLKKAKKALGPKMYNMIDWAAKRWVAPLENMATLLSERLTALEMIPMDMDYDGDKDSPHKDIADIIKKYLKSPSVDVNSGAVMETDRAVVIFQLSEKSGVYTGQKSRKKEASKYHTYIPKFNNTVAMIVNELYQEDIDVPVTPIAFYSIGRWNTPGKWWNPTAKIWMNIGKEINFRDFAQQDNPIYKFTDHMEYAVAELLKDMGVSNKQTLIKQASK